MNSEQFTDYTERKQPILNTDALFSDESALFRSPTEPDPGDIVTIRFRTARDNANEIYYISGASRIRMQMEKSVDGFDYYAVNITVGQEPLHYYFEIRQDRESLFYNKLGVTTDLHAKYSFCIHPGFHVPEWSKGAVMYQIYIDRFCNGDPSNDVVDHEYAYINQHVTKEADWYAYGKADMDVGNFFGGDIQGIWDKLDYLQDLGVEVLYLNPIFASPSNHRYDTQDYDYVDPHIGKIVVDGEGLLAEEDLDNSHAAKYKTRVTRKENLEASNEFFCAFVEELHRRGMKIILDGVFNHCGSFNKWMDRERIYENQPGYAPGAYVSADSPYRRYFDFTFEHSWPYNNFYDGWWGHNTLPKLNYEASEELRETILRIGEKWVSPPFNCDGWRLDVAADLGHTPEYNHQFWRDFRDRVKKANPNALILAEHYGDTSSWLQGDQWDSVMNYDAFMEPVTWFLTGMQKHSYEFREDMLGNSISYREAMRWHMAEYSMSSILCAMNELDNHDHSRFLTRTNHRCGKSKDLGMEAAGEGVSVPVLREAVMYQMFWPGAPTIYYGDEAGMVGFTDPDNRRSYPWGRENQDLIRFYKDAIRIHREYPMLRTSSVVMLTAEKDAMAFGRFNQNEQIAVVVNNSDSVRRMEVPVWRMGIDRHSDDAAMELLIETTATGYTTETRKAELVHGYLILDLEPYTAAAYKAFKRN
ncbi:MAG: glycoside hydrolase family 13 protein [Lachnospiraceae bacterium]|nr:glycoside hydrolase family 13 protein [Lachnospiraceae bacterium]